MSVDTDTDETPLAEQLAELVRSGGYPYIKITLVDPESGGVEIVHHGLRDDVDLVEAFRQLADLIEQEQR